jgi:hypothetical protein
VANVITKHSQVLGLSVQSNITPRQMHSKLWLVPWLEFRHPID